MTTENVRNVLNEFQNVLHIFEQCEFINCSKLEWHEGTVLSENANAKTNIINHCDDMKVRLLIETLNKLTKHAGLIQQNLIKYLTTENKILANEVAVDELGNNEETAKTKLISFTLPTVANQVNFKTSDFGFDFTSRNKTKHGCKFCRKHFATSELLEYHLKTLHRNKHPG